MHLPLLNVNNISLKLK